MIIYAWVYPLKRYANVDTEAMLCEGMAVTWDDFEIVDPDHPAVGAMSEQIPDDQEEKQNDLF